MPIAFQRRNEPLGFGSRRYRLHSPRQRQIYVPNASLFYTQFYAYINATYDARTQLLPKCFRHTYLTDTSSPQTHALQPVPPHTLSAASVVSLSKRSIEGLIRKEPRLVPGDAELLCSDGAEEIASPRRMSEAVTHGATVFFGDREEVRG